MTWPIALFACVLSVSLTVVWVAGWLFALGRRQIDRERDMKRGYLDDVPRLRDELDAILIRVNNLSDQTSAILSRRK